jgi:hypothetical protein
VGSLCDHALKIRDHKPKKCAADSVNMLQSRHSLRDMGEIRAIHTTNDSLALATSGAARREDRTWQTQSGPRP